MLIKIEETGIFLRITDDSPSTILGIEGHSNQIHF